MLNSIEPNPLTPHSRAAMPADGVRKSSRPARTPSWPATMAVLRPSRSQRGPPAKVEAKATNRPASTIMEMATAECPRPLR